MAGAAGGLAAQRGDFRGEAIEVLAGVLDDRRGRALAQRDLGAGGIEHADGLVRQLAATDVTVRQAHRLGDRLVHHADAEVLLHQRHHPAQHRRAQHLGRLLDLDHLEAAGQRGVLLEVLLVLAPGGRGDGAQLAARERRLEQVGGVVLAGLAAGTDHGVGLVNEQHDRVRALLDLVDHALEAVLELALDARAGLQQAEVEHVQFDRLEHVGHVAFGNPRGQSFDHRGLADAGLAGEDRVVLPAPQQNVDHLPDLGVAADHRVDVAVAGALGEIGRVLVQRRGLRQARVDRHLPVFAPAPAHGRIGEADSGCLAGTVGQPGEVVLELVALDLHEPGRTTVGQLRQRRLGQQCQQQVAAADAGGMRVQRGQQPGVLEQRRQVRGEHRRAAVAGPEPAQLVLQVAAQRLNRDPAPGCHQCEVPARILQQGQEQVLQVDLVMPARHAQVGGALGGLAAGVVELPDQGLEVAAHVHSLQWCVIVNEGC